MKRIIAVVLIFICVFSFTSCQPKNEGKDILEPHFTGRVVEKYEKSCLVEVTDIGNGHLAVGDKVVVSTDVKNCPQFDTDDLLIIVFDGMVAETYPPQIFHVSSITKTEANANR